MPLKSVNPYTNKLIEEFNELTDEQINQSVLQTSEAFNKWKKTSHAYRRSVMLNVSGVLRARSGQLARSITEEMGKILKESVAEVEKCAWVCEYYAEKAEDFLKVEHVASDASESYVAYEPLGSILGIMPWNFPFWQVFRFAVPTLMAGNTVILKHASNVQRCGRLIEVIFSEAGFDPSVFINLAIGSARIGAVIENEAIKAVSLTGSEKAGQKVAETSGRKIKKTVLELGGSNAFIVLEDADIEKAVETAIKSRMQNAGQSCIAAKRFIVDKRVSEKFITLFSEKVKNLKYGDPMKDETSIGPLCSTEQANTVEKQVRASVDKGAQIVAGGYPINALYPPSLVVDVKPGMPLFDEEVFGPVAPVIISDGIEDAVRISNSSRFGLGVNLFTNNIDTAKKLAGDFEDGAVFINAMVKSDPRLPFGGTKYSGYGRELGAHGIREFVNVKTIYIR